MPSRTTMTTSSMAAQSSKRCQVWATTGRPATSRKSLSVPAPMRVPRPAATMMALFTAVKVAGSNAEVQELHDDSAEFVPVPGILAAAPAVCHGAPGNLSARTAQIFRHHRSNLSADIDQILLQTLTRESTRHTEVQNIRYG